MTYILTGDCLAVMPTLEAESVDAIVSDPPYGLAFMGKAWDHGVPGPEFWREAFRVAKPGAHLVAFGGTRTYHRLTCAIEDAGWEIRDCLSWLYGSGFPKSLDVSKAMDKAAGAEREVVGAAVRPDGSVRVNTEKRAGTSFNSGSNDKCITAPATALAREWQGWGTALKPAWEPIILARKPLTGTVASNVAQHGTGALNVDGSRIGLRWPANVCLDEEAASLFPESRFFYVAKASRREREAGLEGMPKKEVLIGAEGHAINPMTGKPVVDIPRANGHPTVKPIALMRWLCRLVTPKGGLILDPFTGSGTTGCAAVLEGFRFVGIEREPEYAAIAEKRIAHWAGQVEEPTLFG